MVTTTTGLATSFIQFTRTSNATVTDSNGFIEWAGHNLLTNSESFDASAWVKSSATVTANTDPAPNGTTTGDTIAASGANGTALQTWTAEAVPYTFGIWLRRKTGAGNIQIAADSGTYTTVTITSSWALYTVTQTPAAGSKSAGIRIVTSGDEVYAWGAHLYRSDLGGMVANPARGDAYYPTTPRNLLGFTEDFSNAAWTKSGNLAFGSGSVSNAIIAPNGLQTADLFVESTGAVAPQVFQSVSAIGSGTPVTLSVYAKYAGRVLQLAFGSSDVTSNPRANFDLQNGLTGSVDAGIAASITPVGNGWYRCSATATTAVSSAFDCLINLVNSTTSARSAVYTGDGTSGIYLWGAQLSDSASLDAYSPVYGAAVTSAAYYAPRLDFDPVTLAARGLLVEEQRANIVTYSNDLGSSWTPANATVTTNVATAPDGTSAADKITGDGALAGHYVRNSVTLAINTTYTFSAYIRAAEVSWMYLSINGTGASSGGVPYSTFNASTGALGSLSGNIVSRNIVSVGNGWHRASITFTTAGTVGSNSVEMSVSATDTTGANTTSGGLLYYGAQLEAGSFSTSLIPTGASTATRTADVASVSTQAFPYSSTAGSYVANFQTLFSGTNSLTTTILTVDGSGSKLIAYIAGGAQNPGSFDGSTIVSVANDVTGSVAKIGSSFDASGRSFCANGSTVATGTVAAGYGSGSAVNIGGTLGTGYINGWFRQLTYIPRRLSSSELQARTV